MDFYEVLDQVVDLLWHRGRVTYNALKLQFELDDDQLTVLKDELLYAHSEVVDDEGRGLVWTGDVAQEAAPTTIQPEQPSADQERDPESYTPQYLAEKILTSRSALEGERKQVTVLFCDLVNSTALAERIGPEAMHTLLNRFFELALDDVHRYEGTINQFLGDGFMALFGAPIAHEDHARRGVLATLALQRTLQGHHADLGEPHGVTCQFRMGINSGIVVVGSIGDNLRMDYSAIGDTTNLASRLQGIAEPGEILVSESTSRLVEGYVRLESLLPVRVKGKTEPVPICKVVGPLPRQSPLVARGERTLSAFVGRKREIANLEGLFDQVEAGQGQVVGIVAEAGGGKSRLLYEFRQGLANKRVTYLEGRCLSYGSTIPYHPIIDIVRHNCGITETDGPESITEKIRFALQEVNMDLEESAPYLLQLLGVKAGTESIDMLTPEVIKRRTFETLRHMSLNGSQQRPLIFEIEDLHWIDKTSEDYLASLVEDLVGVSILLLTTYRPGYRPRWLEKSYAVQFSLQSLTPQDGLTVVRSAGQHDDLPEQVAQTIIDKAEGNPFFLEELTRVVVEHGGFQADVTVPDTIQGVLSARIDHLEEEQKRLLQAASVLGREFSPRLLEALWEDPGSLEPILLELKRLEFLYQRRGLEESTFVFKHALTQVVAYESLLTTRRQMLHSTAGQALEALYADRLEDAYDHLAYHYARTNNASKAVNYLTRLAEKAARGYAHEEAVATLQEALVHIENLPADQDRDRLLLDLTLRQAYSLYYLGRFPESAELLVREQARLESIHDPSLAGPYYFWLSHMYTRLGEHEKTTQSAERAIQEAKICGDEAIQGKAYCVLATEGIWMKPLQGIACGRQAVSLLQRTADRYWLGMAYFYLAFSFVFAGEFEPALEAATTSFAIGEAIPDPRVQSYGLWTSGLAQVAQGDWELGVETFQRMLTFAPDPTSTAYATASLGYAYLEKGDATEAIPLLDQAVQQFVQFRLSAYQGWFTTLLGKAHCLNGQIEMAQDLAQQGLKISRDSRFWYAVGLGQRTLGHIAQSVGKLAAAKAHLQEALTTFHSIQARCEVARTHLDLALLAHTQGQLDTATTHLSTAYAWFKKLQVPKWVEKTEQLAQEHGVTLTEVELEELTEDGT